MREIEDTLRRLQPITSMSIRFTGPTPWLRSKRPQKRCTPCTTEKVRLFAIGVSNFSIDQMNRFRLVAPLHVLQPPYNLFERGSQEDLLPYCRENKIAMFGYGALCRGLLSGRMRADTAFGGDDLRRSDPKFVGPRFAQYLSAVQKIDQLARQRFGKHVIHLAIRWMLDQGITTALWGARHPKQLLPVDEIAGWRLSFLLQRRRSIESCVKL